MVFLLSDIRIQLLSLLCIPPPWTSRGAIGEVYYRQVRIQDAGILPSATELAHLLIEQKCILLLQVSRGLQTKLLKIALNCRTDIWQVSEIPHFEKGPCFHTDHFSSTSALPGMGSPLPSSTYTRPGSAVKRT